ncbi:MAG: glutaredoxin domain-containing protein [Pseudomonadota bacterium]|nr:glutaredoxin domain-containing protein [Pseudomonadota bacterium]
MKLLITLLAAGAAFWFYTNGGLPGMTSGVFLPDGSPGVSLVTSDQCGSGCDKARQFLHGRGIAFTEINASQDPEGWKALGKPRKLPFLATGHEQTAGFNPGFFSSALGSSLGMSGLSAEEQRIYAKHFDAAGEPKVVLYGTDWCGYCNRLRKNLESEGVSYDYRNMEKPSKQTWLMETMGIYGYPVVYVGYERVKKPDFDGVMNTLK